MPSQAAAYALKARIGERTRVLLVEDNPRIRGPLVDLLEAWGYQVESAMDGVEALQKAAPFGPAVVISDLRMPRLDGAQLVRELRTRDPRLKFILYSGGRADEQDLAGLDDVCFLQKPFDPARLREEIVRCIERLLP
ncbi:MAG TPA: response regulator [Terriglobia bacterium]|nr:response regulator [Terriglobia bacterium]